MSAGGSLIGGGRAPRRGRRTRHQNYGRGPGNLVGLGRYGGRKIVTRARRMALRRRKA